MEKFDWLVHEGSGPEWIVSMCKQYENYCGKALVQIRVGEIVLPIEVWYSQIFKTRQEAQAECDRRNKKGEG